MTPNVSPASGKAKDAPFLHRWGNFLAFIVGGAGIACEILYRVFLYLDPSLEHRGLLEEVMIVLLSFLFVGLGIERKTTIREMEEKLEAAEQVLDSLLSRVTGLGSSFGRLESDLMPQLEATLRAAVLGINNVEVLVDAKGIAAMAMRLVRDCHDYDTVMATGQHRQNSQDERGHFESLAARAAKAKQSQGGKPTMKYRVILPPKKATAAAEAEDVRVSVFRAQGCAECIELAYSKHPYPLDVMIAGHEMILALRESGDTATYEVALRIGDLHFVEKAVEWFHYQWRNAERP